jgi:hypothetical protein
VKRLKKQLNNALSANTSAEMKSAGLVNYAATAESAEFSAFQLAVCELQV